MTSPRQWNSTLRARTKPLLRSSSPSESPRPRTRTPRTAIPKKSANWLRAFGSPERVEWIKGLPSVASGKGPCVNAHVRTGGISRKADACWIVPLTDAEHRHELHQHGARWFEAKYQIDLQACAVATEAAWRTYIGEAA